MRRVATAVLALVCTALLGAGGGAARSLQEPKLVATVGPEFTISLQDAQGDRVTQLDPGTYEIEVTDRSDFHNFHLMGPKGYSKVLTGIGYVGQKSYKGTTAIKLTPGKWRYVCDPHSLQMKGSFTVTR